MSDREIHFRPNHPALLTTTFMAVYATHSVLLTLSTGTPAVRVVDASVILSAVGLYIGDTLTPF